MSGLPDQFFAELRNSDLASASWELVRDDGQSLATLFPRKRFEISKPMLLTTAVFGLLALGIMVLSLSSSNGMPIYLPFFIVGIIGVNLLLFNRFAGTRVFRTEGSELFLKTAWKKGTMNDMVVEGLDGLTSRPLFTATSDSIDFLDGRTYRHLTDPAPSGNSVRVLGLDTEGKYNRSVVYLSGSSGQTGGPRVMVDGAEQDRPYLEALVGYAVYSYHFSRSSGMYNRRGGVRVR